eukprot:10279740-Alexandrium_andersonii.AAC.1
MRNRIVSGLGTPEIGTSSESAQAPWEVLCLLLQVLVAVGSSILSRWDQASARFGRYGPHPLGLGPLACAASVLKPLLIGR